jgi:inward rectifier potassium channel
MLSPRDVFQQRSPFANTNPDKEDDFGFGSRVAEETAVRLVNRNGTFNVSRWGLSFLHSLSLYHALLTMTWTRFILVAFTAFSIVNAAFAGLLMLAGPDALVGGSATTTAGRFMDAFFFSAQTFTTVGYGGIHPGNRLAVVLSALDAFMGLLTFALAAGLVFARFSRPTARIRFSKNAVIAPYNDISAFEFRIANVRRGHLIEVDAKVGLRLTLTQNGRHIPRFYSLDLEREKVAFFPLHWTIVHPIDDDSPLGELDERALEETQAEFIIQVTAIDETSSQVVHARSSYRFDEVKSGYRFTNILEPTRDGQVHIDLHRLDEIEPV